MNAYEIPNLRYSLSAGGAVDRRRFVSVNSDSQGIQATAATEIIGASMNEVTVDQVLEIADGIVMVTAAEAITAGAVVYSDADGKVATTGTIAAGVAITGAAVDGLVAIKIK